MDNKETSYTAADTLPIKLMLEKEVIDDKGLIKPKHAQFIPTNRCNLNCSFCSCSARDKQVEMSYDDAIKIINSMVELGTKAVTITGGGEPLLHPDIERIITYFYLSDIKVGLVTNGLLLDTINPEVLNKVTWCRISSGDERIFNKEYQDKLSKVVKSCPDVDWAFSHVVTTNMNFGLIGAIVNFANEHSFTHVRLVTDIFTKEDIDLSLVEEFFIEAEITDDLVIYQGRKEYMCGSDCYIGYLKPLIGADCKVYACCGVQYAFQQPTRDLPDELCLGSAFDLEKIYLSSNSPLDGSQCVKCYYDNYNTILSAMLKGIEHKEFI